MAAAQRFSDPVNRSVLAFVIRADEELGQQAEAEQLNASQSQHHGQGEQRTVGNVCAHQFDGEQVGACDQAACDGH